MCVHHIGRMPSPTRQPATRRRALEILADRGHEGCTESVMLAHGFTVAQLVELTTTGLASVTPRHVREARATVETEGQAPRDEKGDRGPGTPVGCDLRT
jgi:hypothetical protein